MSDPMAEMMLEATAQEAAEEEQRTILLQRITELRDMVAKLAQAVETLISLEKMENQQESSRSFTVDERDEYGQIKRFTLN
jgi:hypothetical protein